jgi:hypothetical protein
MRIPPEKIRNRSFRKLLATFRELNLELVVWGGACRDLLFSIYFPEQYSLNYIINDFDIAIILDENDIDDNLEYISFGNSFKILPTMMAEIKKLCNYWNINARELNSEKNIKIDGLEIPVGLAGLRTVLDSNGNLYPDCFAMKNGKTMNSVPICLSINSFGIDRDGNVYGPEECLCDFRIRMARILRNPKINEFALPLLLRLIDYKKRYHLILERRSSDLLRLHIEELYDSQDIFNKSMEIPWTISIIKKYRIEQVKLHKNNIREYINNMLFD